jgi:hypothetical protein
MTSQSKIAQFNWECIAPFRTRGNWDRSFVFASKQCPPRPCLLHPRHSAACCEKLLSVQEVYDEQMKSAISRDFGVRSAILRIRGEEKMLHHDCSVSPLCNTIASDVWLLLRQKLSVKASSRNTSYLPTCHSFWSKPILISFFVFPYMLTYIPPRKRNEDRCCSVSVPQFEIRNVDY